jgi:predicted GNAT family acetyltransferase
MSIPADQIALERSTGSGRYSYTFADGEQAELTYVERGDNVIAITHTYTPPHHRGQGTAAVLVERAVSEARKTGTKIIPACWFAREQFQFHPEWRDLLHG